MQALVSVPLRDALRRGSRRPGAGPVREHLEQAIEWLCRTHDATGRQGSSKGYHLVRGWLPAYPETTGYVLGTLLEFGGLTGRAELAERAREMGDWEAGIQEPDGGIMLGHVETVPRRSIVFNTGMVLHGWVDLVAAGEERFQEPARRAAQFLTEKLGPDGTWAAEVEYSGLPHTYNSRVSWAMLRYAEGAGDDAVRSAALRNLDWVLSQQRDNGWFDSCVFKLGTSPSTHAIAYTMRGLLESYAIAGDERHLEAVLRTSDPLIAQLERSDLLPATYDASWTPQARFECLTGTAQLGGVWLRMHELTGDARFMRAGAQAVEQAAARQERSGPPAVRGALAGSYPVWGRYAPMQYPNWATKFLADSLMMLERLRPA